MTKKSAPGGVNYNTCIKKMDQLTVFVINAGESTFQECIKSLENQTCDFKLEVIQNLYPMSRAFQAMPKRCKTKYFVQVDSDMILEPDAIETLYRHACSSGYLTTVICGQLYEEGFGVGGTVRLWKKHMFDFLSFKDCRTVDRNLFKRSRLFGFRRKYIKTILGLHKPRHSIFSEYLKTKADIEKWRFLKRPPEKYAEPLFYKVIEDTKANGHKFLGIFMGSLTLNKRLISSKNIEFETLLYKKLLQLLGFFHDEILIIKHDFDRQRLWKLFAENYKNNSQEDARFRDLLICWIIEQFSKKGLTPLKFTSLKTLIK